MKINANGISINYQIDGPDGAPWLIFSNSLLTNLSMWDDQAAALKKTYRVLRYDQRGHGGTQATDGKYSFDMLTADVIALMDALSIKRAHFAGISMGGMTALFLAQKHPDRFDRIIACDCGPASTPASAQQWKERIELAAGKGMEALADVTIPRWFPPEFVATKAPVLDKVRGMINATPLAGLRRLRGGAVGLRPASPDWPASRTPTLLIVGTKDATFPGMKQINEAVRARSWSSSKAPATSPIWSSRRPSPRRSRISSRADGLPRHSGIDLGDAFRAAALVSPGMTVPPSRRCGAMRAAGRRCKRSGERYTSLQKAARPECRATWPACGGLGASRSGGKS